MSYVQSLKSALKGISFLTYFLLIFCSLLALEPKLSAEKQHQQEANTLAMDLEQGFLAKVSVGDVGGYTGQIGVGFKGLGAYGGYAKPKLLDDLASLEGDSFQILDLEATLHKNSDFLSVCYRLKVGGRVVLRSVGYGTGYSLDTWNMQPDGKWVLMTHAFYPDEF